MINVYLSFVGCKFIGLYTHCCIYSLVILSDNFVGQYFTIVISSSVLFSIELSSFSEFSFFLILNWGHIFHCLFFERKRDREILIWETSVGCFSYTPGLGIESLTYVSGNKATNFWLRDDVPPPWATSARAYFIFNFNNFSFNSKISDSLLLCDSL